MPVRLACVNLKGGVGKTTLAVNLAAHCGAKGLKTLLVDLDPQTNATFCLIEPDEWKKHADQNGTVADLLGAKDHAFAEGGRRPAEDVIIQTGWPNVDLIPSHLDLFTVDLDLGGATARETRLRKALAPVLNKYDVLVFDCPPNLTLPTQNALAAATHYIVPISPDYLSGLGVALLVKRVSTLMAELEHQIEHLGIVLSRVGRPSRYREETTQSLRDQFDDLVLPQELTERSDVSEAGAKKIPVSGTSNREAKIEFDMVCEEILTRATGSRATAETGEEE